MIQQHLILSIASKHHLLQASTKIWRQSAKPFPNPSPKSGMAGQTWGAQELG